MARNRKRAKERRARRPQPVASSRTERDDTIDPIRHATPDVELAEAQLAMGRPDVDDPEAAQRDTAEPQQTDSEELTEARFESEEEFADTVAAGGFEAETDYDEVEPSDADGGHRGPGGAEGLDEGDGGGERPALHPVERQRAGGRLVNFVKGSWRELQRVQWPDRRQVVQATGVVLGFVIVAGVYLGVADQVASKLMNWVLK